MTHRDIEHADLAERMAEAQPKGKRLEALAARVEAEWKEQGARDREWLRLLNEALSNTNLPPVQNPADAAARFKDILIELAESDQENDRLRAKVEKATRDLVSLEKIQDACPSCGSPTLIIGPGGRLTCSLAACRAASVGQAWASRKAAADDLARAADDAVKFNGADHRERLAAAVLVYEGA